MKKKTKNTTLPNYWLWLLMFVVLAVLILQISLQKLFTSQRSIDPTHLENQYDPLASRGVFFNRIVSVPAYSEFLERDNYILGVKKTKQPKLIKVDLAKQKVYAYEGKKKIYEFLVSTGLWGRTPTGKFNIWAKMRFTKMEGGFGPTYYNLPNVPYVMFFYNDEVGRGAGYSLHGTYWHDNFGHPMSHGCINMKTEEAALIYYWAAPELNGEQSTYASEKNPGTTIEIYGKAPES